MLGRRAACTREIGKRLQGTEVEVDGLPEKEEDHADERRYEAVDEVGRRKALRGCRCREQREEAPFNGPVDETDDDEREHEDDSDDDPGYNESVFKEPWYPSIS